MKIPRTQAGVNLVHVPYRCAPAAATGLVAGQVQVMFDQLPNSIENIRSGKLRALAVTTATRSKALPGIPTVGEFVPGYEATGWRGIGAPKNTPAEIVERLGNQCSLGQSHDGGTVCRPWRDCVCRLSWRL
jgi:tripartite-type tricarboxylate transporter receptor subunit TctC